MTVSQIDRSTGLSSSAAIKAPCYLATTANITLSGVQTIDGVSATAGKRVLVKDQTDASQNGIYIVATGDWTRAPDLSSNDSIREGTRVLVTDGSTQTGVEFVVTVADPISIGTTLMTWATSASLSLGAAMAAAINAATAKATPVDADKFGFWDSVTGLFRQFTWANLKSGIWTSLGALIAAGTVKSTPVSADKIAIADSAASNATKYVALTSLLAMLSVSGNLNGLLDLSGASAGQIKFPATANPSSDANTLDDYEEGTFTPTFTATGATFSYTTQSGQYTKIGNRVVGELDVVLATSGNTLSANPAFIAGLPFPVGGNFNIGGPLLWGNATSSYVSVMGIASIGTSTIALNGATAAATSVNAAQNANAIFHATNASRLRANFNYIAG